MTWELILDGYSESSYSATPRFAAARLPWFYKSGTFRYEDVLWPEAASDETKKRTAFAGTAISIV
ncbi:hypothetical protein F3196_23830 [Escherichia coli]|nr:hypothetical protein [Escherichia coli]